MLATPVETVPRGAGDIARIRALSLELDAIEIIVGLPLALSGRDTASTADARSFARALASRLDVPVRVVDERLSSVSANSALRASGRTTKNSRSVVDQVAAVIILQHALDFERSASTAPGALVDTHEGNLDG
jgi:putative Holliday junction resolvase